MANIETEILLVTPAMAEEYMGKNQRNRRLRPAWVTILARQMTEGRWTLNGDAIRFSVGGALLDGQHRLAAIIASGIPQMMLIVRGLDEQVQGTMDQHAKRTVADVLGMHGIPSATKVGAVVRMVHRWNIGERSLMGFGGTSDRSLTADEVLTVVRQDERFIEAVRSTDVAPLTSLASPTVIFALRYLTMGVDQGASDAFFESLRSGANLEEGSPVLTLRRYWARLRGQTSRPPVGLYLMTGVRCWNAYVEGRSLSQISYKTPVIPEISVPKSKAVAA